MALAPISWGVAALIVYALLLALSVTSDSSIRDLLATALPRLLIVILPGFIFGKTLGLMVANLVALCIPELRRTFQDEEAQTGRPGFSVAMRGLVKAAAVLAIITALGLVAFLSSK